LTQESSNQASVRRWRWSRYSRFVVKLVLQIFCVHLLRPPSSVCIQAAVTWLQRLVKVA